MSDFTAGFPPNFKLSEFLVSGPVGQPLPADPMEAMIVAHELRCLAWQLQMVRNEIGVPMTITSGYRSEARNREIYEKRGKEPPKSCHCLGQACDVIAQGLTGKQLHAVFARMMGAKQIMDGGLGIYDSRPVHYDTGDRRRWDWRGR